jgi:alpha-galactosidase
MEKKDSPRRRAALLAALAALALTAGAAVAVPAAAQPSAPAALAPAAEFPPAGDEAATPYMGWSSYSMQVLEGGDWITADQLKAQSDAMHEKLQEFGYDYLNVDAGWNGGIDEYGRPTPSTTVFPDGIQDVIDHVHNNGQRFGLYGIPGISESLVAADLPIHGAPGCTTSGLALEPRQLIDAWDFGVRIDFSNPCAQKYIDSIADLYASWGVDFLKFDSVTPGSGFNDLSRDARDEVAAWSQALEPHGIWLELSWALDIRYADFWREHANGWRIDWDVECYCEGEALTTWPSIERLLPKLADWWREGGPGGWNDLDSLNVGNGKMDGLTRDERRAATTLWAVSAAPLYVGNDLTQLDEFGLTLLTNPEVIAVNQAGVPARPVSVLTDHQVWYSLNADSSYTVAVFNLGRTEADIEVSWSDLGLTGSARVRDLWATKNLGSFEGAYVAESVPINGARLFRLTPAKDSRITVTDDDLRVEYEGDWDRNSDYAVPAVTEALGLTVVESGGAPAEPDEGVRTVEVNDTDGQIVYGGSWGYSNNRGLGDFQDDVHYSEVNGTSFEYTFVGTGIDYVTETHESQGEVEIYLDGELVDTVDTFLPGSEGRGAQQVVYSVSDLPSGTHTIRGVKKSGSFMLLDKFNVRKESLLGIVHATFDRADPQDIPVELRLSASELLSISHAGTTLEEGTDYTIDGDVVTIRAAYLEGLALGDTSLEFRFRGDHHNDVHVATENGAAIEFSFRGRAVSWITALAPDQGEVEIYLDGELVETVDLSSDYRVAQQEVFSIDGLSKNDLHTIRIVKVSGDVLRNDVFRYTSVKI